jgi:AAA+ ATPase superfamily predicted ATPase
MPLSPLPPDMVGRADEWQWLSDFATSDEAGPSLGIVSGRRRVGKSFLLQSLVEQMGGFYYAAVRGLQAEALADLGEKLGAYLGAGAPLAFSSWSDAVDRLIALGQDGRRLVVLDEYPYLLEHTPELDSYFQRALGVRRSSSRKALPPTRIILCGSAISVMREVLGGTAPLRGRAGLTLRVSPFDLRTARELHGCRDLETAFRIHAVIGGVAAYAREMVDGDLPSGPEDFDRWVTERVLSARSPLLSEIPLLLSEDPVLSKARKPNLYHATLGAIARGNHAFGKITGTLGISGTSLQPVLDVLTSTELIERVEDPVRQKRPTYHPADQLLRFHYAVIRPHQARLLRAGADTSAIWASLQGTFRSRVLGPAFEAAARDWVRHEAPDDMLEGPAVHVGDSVVILQGGDEVQLDVVVAADDADEPGKRTILAIGEAKAGRRLDARVIDRLTAARSALGPRAAGAKLLAFGASLGKVVRGRSDVVAVDLERLYG